MPEQRGQNHEKVEPPRAFVCFYEDFNRAELFLKNPKKFQQEQTPSYHNEQRQNSGNNLFCMEAGPDFFREVFSHLTGMHKVVVDF
jgi:hypothetical protein